MSRFFIPVSTQKGLIDETGLSFDGVPYPPRAA